MADPMACIQIGLAEQLKMLPSEFRRRATKWDIVQMLAWGRTQDKEWCEEYERQSQIEKSRSMTGKQKFSALRDGLRGN